LIDHPIGSKAGAPAYRAQPAAQYFVPTAPNGG
jgi:hypothetical protein